jgi:spore germination cell wall hydrolase CwlJ-like protein
MPSDRIALPALRLPRMPRMPELRHWLSSFVLATLVGLYVVAGLSVAPIGPASRAATPRLSSDQVIVPGLGKPPEPEPLQFREIAPQDAVAVNAAIPIAALPNPAARPFKLSFATPADRLRALECLTAAVYYEAAIEPTEGQRAVAQVVLNRARHPAYPRSVCGVVFQGQERVTGCQFTFTCDGALRRTPSASGWARARRVAEEALAGYVYKPVGWATHYHTNWVVPYWSSSLVKIANVGTHIFYRWEGGWGRPGAFRYATLGTEPQMARMRQLTSDPTTLANAVEVPVTVDEAAAAAAAAALAAGDTKLAPAGQPSIDSFQRAVLRRYEPMTREAATAAAVARSKEPMAESTHWALSGLPAKPAAPLGAKPKATAGPPAAAAAPPRCLEGVRRLPAVAGPPDKQAC